MNPELQKTRDDVRSESKPGLNNKVFSPAKTREFLLAAYQEGAIEMFLTDPDLRPFLWPRRVGRYNIVISYFATPGTIEEIAQAYSKPRRLTHQAISQTIVRTLKEIRDYVSTGLKEKFPLDQIPKNKNGQENTNIIRGLSKGYRSSKAAVLAQEGKSPAEIKKSLGQTALNSARTSYESLNIPFSERYLLSQQIRQEIANTSLTYPQIKDLWGKIPFGRVRQLSNEGLILSLITLTRLAKLHIRPDKVPFLLPVLERAGVIVRLYERKVTSKGETIRQKYYFLRKADIAKAKKALEKAEELKKFFENPVKLLSKAEQADWPTTNDLKHNKGYKSINKLSGDFGISFGGHNKPVSDEFFKKCPYPVFKYRRVVYYPVEMENKIVSFIQRRKKELGL